VIIRNQIELIHKSKTKGSQTYFRLWMPGSFFFFCRCPSSKRAQMTAAEDKNAVCQWVEDV